MILVDQINLVVEPNYEIIITPVNFTKNTIPIPFEIKFYGDEFLFSLGFYQVDNDTMTVTLKLGKFYMKDFDFPFSRDLPIKFHHYYILCESGYIKFSTEEQELLIIPVENHGVIKKLVLDAEYGFCFIDFNKRPKLIEQVPRVPQLPQPSSQVVAGTGTEQG